MLWGRYAGEVRDSAEFRRVLGLPRRTAPPSGAERLTELFRLPGHNVALRPVQAQALAELHLVGGLLGLIRVGGGKTLITYLAPSMLDVQRPLLLIPAKLRCKTERDFAELSNMWRQPCVSMHIESYERLGRAQWARFLDTYQPDMIIADEAHKLVNVNAAVTRRVGRYMSARPQTHFLALSGTITKRSLLDFAHLAEWALGDGAPVPLEYKDLWEWCLAVDEESLVIQKGWSSRYAPGVLVEFAKNDENSSGDCDCGGSIVEVRQGLRRRIVETPGVVATAESPIDASLVLDDWWRDFKMSWEVQQAYERLRAEWVLPGGQLLMSAADVWRHSIEMVMGFYYLWEPTPPKWWLEPRQKWASFVRKILGHSRILDSELQVARMYAQSKLYLDWAAVRYEYQPTVIAVWLDEQVVQKAVEWVFDAEGIAWVQHNAFAEKLEQYGVPYYGRMGKRRDGALIEDATGGIAASIEANKEGRNLQRYNRNLVLTPPSTGLGWEQLLGRTHRDGQMADEVSVEIFFGCKENINAFIQAKSDAEYQHGLTGSPQKLLEATTTF